MRRIIVIGYPKSGTTWLTRVVAELVGCPVAGFWGSDHFDPAVDGVDRVSVFRCFKAHQQLHELGVAPDDPVDRLIYVIRDPRDVVVSGSYFRYDPDGGRVHSFLARLPRGTSVYRRVYRPLWDTFLNTRYHRRRRIELMVRWVLHGSARVHHFYRVPWEAHWRPFEDRSVLFVRYEDMLEQPQAECDTILRYLGLSRSERHVEGTIDNQSFPRMKADLESAQETPPRRLMRLGKSGQWKAELSEGQKQRFIDNLRDELEHFGYEI
ncbi:MAG: sulfotransferase domain-containing protein [Anaerolineae bacterium]|jgi:hypothetical protein